MWEPRHRVVKKHDPNHTALTWQPHHDLKPSTNSILYLRSLKEKICIKDFYLLQIKLEEDLYGA